MLSSGTSDFTVSGALQVYFIAAVNSGVTNVGVTLFFPKKSDDFFSDRHHSHSARAFQEIVCPLEVKREYYPNCSVLGCVTQCSQSAAHSCVQFLQVQQIGFVTFGPLRHA